MKHLSTTTINQIKYALFVACLLPFLKLIFANCTATTGPDPVADITHITGIWALNLLLITLAISPLRKLTHWNWLMRLRRTLALYAFFYAGMHLFAYLVFDQFFDWAEIGKDISRRPYMMAGMTSFVLMIPLAATSTPSMMKRLGGRYWQMLHRLAYPVAAAGVVHYFWLVKQDITNPSIYAIILLVLFCARLTKTKQPVQEAGRLKSLKGMKSA
ncbi:MAG: sulfoxide reductase heme-binding subunit YedZ [Proteobacteria bacterium]|nr:sulfoxide reductase heme-binding subunit YedZ [Pseudomonadota bacterium]